MTLHQLEIFAAVAKHRNITKASEELHITQPSVSQQLKFLEEECGVKLYKKMSRGIELTERGQLFLTDTVPLLLQVERLKEKFKDSPTDGKVRSLVIGGSHSQSVSFLPLPLAVFKETRPQVQVTLRSDSSRMIEQSVLNSEIEIGLITNPSYFPLLIYEPYQREKLVLFIALKHPLANKKKWTLEDLSGTPLVVKARMGGEVSRVEKILKQLENRGIQLNIVMRCESGAVIKTAVKTGVGMGILYRGDYLGGDINPDKGDLKTIEIPELKMKVDTFIIYSKESPLSHHAQDFLTLLRQWRLKTRWAKDSLRVAV